jgi:hypothetical protein
MLGLGFERGWMAIKQCGLEWLLEGVAKLLSAAEYCAL